MEILAGRLGSLLLYCWSLLGVIHLASAQNLIISFSGNSSRVIGHGVFSRDCRYSQEGNTPAIDRMEWLLNGAIIESEINKVRITLTINEPTAMNGGQYSCVVHFVSGTSQEASAGFLIIYTEQSINAPPSQRVVADSDSELQCASEIPGTHTTLRNPGNVVLPSATLHQVNLEHQGRYECSIVALSEGGNLIYTTFIQLQVIVPPKIINNATVKATYGNEPATFTVGFLSTFESNTTVTWNFNSLPLSSQEFVTTEYVNETAGSTTLEFLQLTRSDKGIYTVIIDNNMTLLRVGNSARTSFTVNVEVPPALPTAPVFVTFNNTLSKIAWNLTNTTADAGPEALIVNIQNHPDSPINLEPSQTHLFVDTEPGVTYTVTIEAINTDSSVTSQPSHLILQPEPPLLTDISVIRVNETVFNFTLEVKYTGAGGGSLTLVNIMFREAETTTWNHHNQLSIELTLSRQTWYALVTNNHFAAISDVQFSFTTQNEMKQGIEMEARQIIVVPGVPENISSTSVTSNSFRLQARLSTMGTSPIFSANFLISGPDGFVSHSNVTENVLIGELVETDVGGLSPGTSYSVVVYATNAAGSGLASREHRFETLNVPSVLPLWIILVIAVVGSLVLLILLLLLLVSCCCRRKNDKKLNLSANLPRSQLDRPGPLGATDSIDSIHTSSNYYYNQKSIQGFVLSPPPSGYPLQHPSLPPSQPTLSPSRSIANSSNTGQSSGQYSYAKPRLHSSPLESDISVQSSKYNHFNFHHSPVPERSLNFENAEKYSQSMPVLDDPDLSPTMPPNCATDV